MIRLKTPFADLENQDKEGGGLSMLDTCMTEY